MQRWLVAVIAFAACGGPPPPPIASPPPVPAATSCTDAGVILRGSVDDAAHAGAAREAAIAAACTTDRWSAAVLACIGASRQPAACLDKLTHAQHANYDTRIAQWSDEYGGSSYGGVDDTVVKRTTECADVAPDAGRYPPELGATAPERDWDIGERKRTIVTSCEHGQWREETKACLADGDRPEGCLYDEPNHDTLEAELTTIDELAGKIAAAKLKPASIDCKKVAAAWYSEARWKDKLAALKPGERTKQLAASRAAMQKLCGSEGWTDSMRACFVADGSERCFGVIDYTDAWSLPALVTTLPTNDPPECDAYTKTLFRMFDCGAFPQTTRDAVMSNLKARDAGWTSLASAARAMTCRNENIVIVRAGKAACNW